MKLHNERVKKLIMNERNEWNPINQQAFDKMDIENCKKIPLDSEKKLLLSECLHNQWLQQVASW